MAAWLSSTSRLVFGHLRKRTGCTFEWTLERETHTYLNLLAFLMSSEYLSGISISLLVGWIASVSMFFWTSSANFEWAHKL